MSNNEYKDNELELFRLEFGGLPLDYPEWHEGYEFMYNGTYYQRCWGIEFSFRNHFYRMTVEQTGDDDFLAMVRDKFHKPNGIYELYILPVKEYLEPYDVTLDIYLGIYDNVDDLLENAYIDGVKFKDLIVSSETEILGID